MYQTLMSWFISLKMYSTENTGPVSAVSNMSDGRTKHWLTAYSKIVIEYDQEIPQSQTADKPVDS